MNRNRILYLVLAVITIIVGLLTRRFSAYFPDIINLGLGDALWAVMMYWMVAFVFPRYSIKKVAILSLMICFIVETSQLYQAEWINSLRSHRLGALVLGRGFLWSDFLAYMIGVGACMGIETYRSKKKSSAKNSG
jgi:hypothetical protein